MFCDSPGSWPGVSPCTMNTCAGIARCVCIIDGLHMNEHRFGRIDVHSHLLPGVDDGCASIEDSIACAARMVAAGYTHSFCTPHVWPDLPHNNAGTIPH